MGEDGGLRLYCHTKSMEYLRWQKVAGLKGTEGRLSDAINLQDVQV